MSQPKPLISKKESEYINSLFMQLTKSVGLDAQFNFLEDKFLSAHTQDCYALFRSGFVIGRQTTDEAIELYDGEEAK